ncbi:hypothetical protein OG948_02080 [Embleya sp. NBC_00888]|uniref:hypothetical protein n=1 Tax=Embleya sp. NBC_00888 TaxID=2975960 RepID=UPI00386882F3|nr:hypothetical protein OG948_02080 [Embleya sp. NBC_00888]
MRSRFVAVTAAALAAVAALAQPAQAAPLMDGVYRFPALSDGKCLTWPKTGGGVGTVSLGACTDTASTSANWQVRQRSNGTMEVSAQGSGRHACLRVTDSYHVVVSDNCGDIYADWTVSVGSDSPGSPVYVDIEHTPGDHSASWGSLVDSPGVTGRLVVQRVPVTSHYWTVEQVG